MLERFLRRFVPNYESVEDPAVRKAYGTFSSVVGICCNVVLFLLKYVMGSLSHPSPLYRMRSTTCRTVPVV